MRDKDINLSNKNAFLLLQIYKAEYNPIKHPFFYDWATFVRDNSPDGSYKEEMFVIMIKYYKGTNFSEYLYKSSKWGNHKAKYVASTLINAQISKWKTDNLYDEAVYINLQLNEPNSSPLSNDVFSIWFIFLRLKYEEKGYDKIMFDTMVDYLRAIVSSNI